MDDGKDGFKFQVPKIRYSFRERGSAFEEKEKR